MFTHWWRGRNEKSRRKLTKDINCNLRQNVFLKKKKEMCVLLILQFKVMLEWNASTIIVICKIYFYIYRLFYKILNLRTTSRHCTIKSQYDKYIKRYALPVTLLVRGCAAGNLSHKEATIFVEDHRISLGGGISILAEEFREVPSSWKWRTRVSARAVVKLGEAGCGQWWFTCVDWLRADFNVNPVWRVADFSQFCCPVFFREGGEKKSSTYKIRARLTIDSWRYIVRRPR